ncbi:MAG: EamA family transporter [Clostridia bacterium]|nr:EamA family transporter [Clostridia bacterium]
MGMWIFLVAFYGLAKGAREGLKKKALQKNGVIEVLFFHTALSFIMTLPFSHNVFEISALYHLYVFIKSFSIFLAWILAFNSIKRMPISYYGILDTARMLFSTALALLFLGEQMTWPKGIGLAVVLLGLVLVNLGGEDDEKVKVKYLLMALASCLLNSFSGFMDKKLLVTGQIDSSQLQFWYMLYMTALYGAYILFKRVPISLKTVKTNYWIVILSALFVIADRALFIANEDPQSQVTIMTLLKQSSVLVTVLTGKLFFKEKHILKRSVCAAIVIAGICVATLL